MGIMDFLKRNTPEKARFKEVENEQKILERLEERKLSANERELNRYAKEEREKKLKELLDKTRAQREKASRKFIFKQKNIFANNGSGLNQKNLFTEQRTLFEREKRLFFS